MVRTVGALRILRPPPKNILPGGTMRMHLVAAALAAAVSAAVLVAPAPVAAQQKYITIGTGGVTGVYYAAGGAICRLVNKDRKAHGMRCSVESTGGSVFNINSVMSGDMDVGFAQSDTQYYAMKGEGPFKDKPQPKLRALFSVYPELFTLVARQDANIKRFEDIKGKRINIGDPGSGSRATMELVMKEFGIAPSDLKLASELKFVEMAPALCDNKIDAFVFVAGHPNAIFQEAATSCASTIAAVSGPPIKSSVAANPFYAKADIPGRCKG
jgi:TRAP transporter TAXI family solute receptor